MQINDFSLQRAIDSIEEYCVHTIADMVQAHIMKKHIHIAEHYSPPHTTTVGAQFGLATGFSIDFLSTNKT